MHLKNIPVFTIIFDGTHDVSFRPIDLKNDVHKDYISAFADDESETDKNGIWVIYVQHNYVCRHNKICRKICV